MQKIVKRTRPLNLMGRILLFVVILSMGTVSAVMADETENEKLQGMPVVTAETMTVAREHNILYAAFISHDRPSGIYQSKDHGRTWHLLPSKMNASRQALFIHPENPGVLYASTISGAGTLADSLWRRDDSEQAWRSLTPSLSSAPFSLPSAVTAPILQSRQPQVLSLAADDEGYYFDLERSYYGYELVGALSLQADYGANLRETMIAPDGRVYALTASDPLYSARGGPGQTLEAMLESAASLVMGRFKPQHTSSLVLNMQESAVEERSAHPSRLAPVTAIRVTTVAGDERAGKQLFLAAATYEQGRRWADKAIYTSRDGGRNWTKLAGADGLVVMRLPDQIDRHADSITGREMSDRPYLAVSLREADSSLPLTGTQIFIVMLTGSLAGLALTDRKDWITDLDPVAA